MDAKPFKVLGIDHLGIIPKSPDQATSFLMNLLGLPLMGKDHVAEQEVDLSMLGSSSLLASGGVHPRLEILSPTTQTSAAAKYLEAKGGGIQHLALRVDSIDQALAFLKTQQVDLIDQEARAGAHGTRIAFIHPRATGGILIELVESH